MSNDEERTPEQIQAEIDQTREDLGDTVAAVADKADLKKQAKKKTKKKTGEVKAQVAELKESVTDKASEAKETTSAKIDEVKETAADKVDDIHEASPAPDDYDGSAGDIGSGPTGDIRPNPEVVKTSGGLGDSPVALVAGAFVIGLVIGRFTAR